MKINFYILSCLLFVAQNTRSMENMRLGLATFLALQAIVEPLPEESKTVAEYPHQPKKPYQSKKRNQPAKPFKQAFRQSSK
ncbi:hypothetical protein BH09DEP1_BH09DEP1_1850 [soil metagenome]